MFFLALIGPSKNIFLSAASWEVIFFNRFEVGDGEMWVLGMGWIFSFCSFELMETYPLKRNKHKEG